MDSVQPIAEPSNGAVFRLFLQMLSLLAILLFAQQTRCVAEDNVSPKMVLEGDDRAANSLAKEVFSSRDYWWKRTSAVQVSKPLLNRIQSWIYDTIIEPIWNWIKELIGWIFEKIIRNALPYTGDWSKGFSYLRLLVMIGFALLVAWGIWLVYQFRPKPPSSPISDLEPPISLPQADLLLEEARQRLKNGDARGALRAIFLSLLSKFQDLGVLKYDRSKSNREYQRDLNGNPDLASRFRLIAVPFERCWYGGYDIDPLKVAEFIQICERVGQNSKEVR